MKVFLTNTFKRAAKKLHGNQIIALNQAIEHIQEKPVDGELKTGDLSGVRVYKFHILHQLVLLAYTYDEKENEIILLSFSSHENFYKNLKNQLSH
jgi:mRNA-degrading endonuclease RelE of RelBE toxin-antitoxin system